MQSLGPRGPNGGSTPAIVISLLRGVCQIPAYVAHEKGFFADGGVESQLRLEPTAWTVPRALIGGESQFAVIPWTRAAIAADRGEGLVVVCGSGSEEAAVVVRRGIEVSEVRRVCVPLRGGIKDLTAMALIESLGWQHAEVMRQPSGDGTIIALFGEGCDAASMVEPYATMMETLAVGRVVRRTGDVWPGAPGCSLTTTNQLRDSHPELVAAVVTAFARGIDFTRDNPVEAARIATGYIGVHARFIEAALDRNQPEAGAIRNTSAMEQILTLMVELGYAGRRPTGFADLSFLDRARQTTAARP